ncbi:hypothetical protein GQ457_05G028670 [Hibiscus cannabinus]
MLSAPAVAVYVVSFFLLGRFRSGLFGCRREWYKEINLPALELGLGRDDDDFRDHAVIGSGGGGFLKYVLRVSLHDVSGFDGAGDFFDTAIGVYDSNHIEYSAGKNARDAAPYCVLHGSSFSLLWSLI